MYALRTHAARTARLCAPQILGMLVFVLTPLLAGCVMSTSHATAPASTPRPTSTAVVRVTHAEVTRISGFGSNHIAAFQASVSDPAQAQRLYTAIRALPVSPQTPMADVL